MLKFDREKYLALLRTQGFSAALTALHCDTNDWEIETFEGEKGYQPEMWSKLEEIRKFSRELWELALREQGNAPGNRH